MLKYIFLLFLIGQLSYGNSQQLYFPPISGNAWDTISPARLNWCDSEIDNLYNYLNENNTKAFVLLIDGKIVLEKYFADHTQNSLWQWASAGKVLTSFLVGIAQQEGKLSINEKSSDYLVEGWTNCTAAQEERISIRNQLTMTTGLDDEVADPYCTLDSCLIYIADAGSRWAYHNAPYTLLDQVIEKATGSSLNSYVFLKLRNQIGLTGGFVPVDYNNVFFSTARSMARFGLLILGKGNWAGNSIMTDTSYFNQMINTSQELNQSYGYLWWLNGKSSFMVPSIQRVFSGSLCPNAPPDMIAAMGKDGQFINVIPSKNMVWIRMGEAPESLPVPYLMNDQIWEYINKLSCNASTHNANEEIFQIRVFPNPANDFIKIESKHMIKKIEILDVNGKIVKLISNLTAEPSDSISIQGLVSGNYFVKATFEDGSVATEKLIKDGTI